MRNILFLSHANPEDNEFTLWLALQLTREGYPVWCDLTKLLGGEDFWRDIEKAIRERAQKFLYVLSRVSNVKPGPLQELHVAHNVMRDVNLHDFIIPLLIDDLPHKEINIQLARINTIQFNQGWTHGLESLLKKLEEDEIQKDIISTPSAVSTWWRTQFSAEEGISNQSEEYLSNWFPIQPPLPEIYFHKIHRSGIGKIEVSNVLPYSAFQHENYLVTFAKVEDFKGKLGEVITVEYERSFSTHDFLEGTLEQNMIDRKDARNFVSRLLRIAWEKMLEGRGLPIYELANDTRCCYFTKGLVENDEISFNGVSGKMVKRQIIGYKTMKSSDGQVGSKRFWHFGVQARPLLYPALAYIIKPHVVFSDDGTKIWESKNRLHKARRSQCKNWWNSDWRDRILATMTWLSNDQGLIKIQLGSDVTIHVSNFPIIFTSPVSYSDPVKSEFSNIEDEDEREYHDYDLDTIETGDDE